MFCPNCGTPLVTGTRFCGACGAGIAQPSSVPSAPASPPAPVSTMAAMSDRAQLKKPLSAMSGVLIAIGLLLGSFLVCVIGGYTKNANASTALVVLIVVATSAWAAFDSAHTRIREYKTVLASHPAVLFVGMILLWVLMLPWYLVVRSKIRKGCLERRDHPKGFGFAMLLIPVGVFVVVAFVSAALFMGSGSSIKGIWTVTNSQLEAANAAAVSGASATGSRTASADNALDLRSYVGKVPDKRFWSKDDVVFSGNLMGSGSGGRMARESFENGLDQYAFAPCQYDANTNTVTVTWKTVLPGVDDGDIGRLPDVGAVSLNVNTPGTGLVVSWGDSSDGATITFYVQDHLSPSDASSITKGDFRSLPPALAEWAAALVKQSGKPVNVEVY